jgi:hypothetical protein
MLFSNSSLDFGVVSDSLSKSERSEQTVNRLRVENSVSNAREGDVRISAR